MVAGEVVVVVVAVAADATFKFHFIHKARKTAPLDAVPAHTIMVSEVSAYTLDNQALIWIS
jgi:hypothetical protein